jgi:hypothetical protein
MGRNVPKAIFWLHPASEPFFFDEVASEDLSDRVGRLAGPHKRTGDDKVRQEVVVEAEFCSFRGLIEPPGSQAAVTIRPVPMFRFGVPQESQCHGQLHRHAAIHGEDLAGDK